MPIVRQSYNIANRYYDLAHIVAHSLKVDREWKYTYEWSASLGRQLLMKDIVTPDWEEISYSDGGGSSFNRAFDFSYAILVLSHNKQEQIRSIEVFSDSKARITEFKNLIESKIEVLVLKEKIQMNFWYDTQQGPETRSCALDVPFWRDINQNYSSRIFPQLDALANLNPLANDATAHGKLILLQGFPGTGKTWYIRALAKAWKNWCNFHYIVDVDRFFGSTGGNYMLKVISSFDNESVNDDNDNEGPIGLPNSISQSQKYNLLILEDSGELISKRAREETGQALARLLNISDGLMGQGVKLFILITTNEELEDLHEAVSRPGRCLASITFNKLSVEETDNWLISHNLNTMGKSLSLAELFSIRDKSNAVLGNKIHNKQMGFLKGE